MQRSSDGEGRGRHDKRPTTNSQAVTLLKSQDDETWQSKRDDDYESEFGGHSSTPQVSTWDTVRAIAQVSM